MVRMKWSDAELDTGMWTIPGSETKNNGHPHGVPWTTLVVALLREQRASVPDGPPSWVFSNMLRSWPLTDPAVSCKSTVTIVNTVATQSNSCRRRLISVTPESARPGRP